MSALVFFTPTALAESSSGSSNVVPQTGSSGITPTKSFPTTVTTVVNFTGTVDLDVLATSNVHKPEIKGHLGGTTKGKLIDAASVNTVFGLRASVLATRSLSRLFSARISLQYRTLSGFWNDHWDFRQSAQPSSGYAR
jgi:hypothetical protein